MTREGPRAADSAPGALVPRAARWGGPPGLPWALESAHGWEVLEQGEDPGACPHPVCAGDGMISLTRNDYFPREEGDEGTSKATRVSYKSPGLHALPAPLLLERVGGAA